MQTYTSHFAMQPGMHPEMMQASGEPSRSGEGSHRTSGRTLDAATPLGRPSPAALGAAGNAGNADAGHANGDGPHGPHDGGAYATGHDASRGYGRTAAHTDAGGGGAWGPFLKRVFQDTHMQ